MGAIASQITSLTIVYSTVYSDVDQRKHQSSASLAFVRGIQWGPMNSPQQWPVRRKTFPFHDVIMWPQWGKTPNTSPVVMGPPFKSSIKAVSQIGLGLFDWVQSNHATAPEHYIGVITSAMASQITGVYIVCSIVGPGAYQRKHQSSASLAFVWGIHRWPMNSRTKDQ